MQGGWEILFEIRDRVASQGCSRRLKIFSNASREKPALKQAPSAMIRPPSNGAIKVNDTERYRIGVQKMEIDPNRRSGKAFRRRPSADGQKAKPPWTWRN